MSLHLRRLTIIVICFATATATAWGQTTAPYIFFKPIYAFSANSVKLNETSVQVGGQTITKGTYGSYGEGFCLQAGAGKMISSTFGFELGIEYDHGKKIKTDVSTADSAVGTFQDRMKTVLLKPMLVIRNSGDLLTVYTKLGLAVSVYSHRYQTANVHLAFSGQDYLFSYDSKEDTKVKVGVTAAAGLSFRCSQAISVFGEVNGQMISLPVTKGRYTRSEQNGVNNLPDLTTNMKQWVYVKSLASNAVVDPDKPEPRLYEPANLSYIGISIGILYHF